MRKPERLYNFYMQLASRHVEIPDMRFGQLMYSFIRWAEMENKDVFYLEEDDFINLYDKFIRDIQAKYIGAEGKFGGV